MYRYGDKVVSLGIWGDNVPQINEKQKYHYKNSLAGRVDPSPSCACTTEGKSYFWIIFNMHEQTPILFCELVGWPYYCVALSPSTPFSSLTLLKFLSQLTEKLQDTENESMAKIAELEKQLCQSRREVEYLKAKTTEDDQV